MSYSLYTGGLKTLATTLRIENGADTYRLVMKGRTAGLLSIFTTWEGTMETEGRYLDGGRTLARSHKSISRWPENTQIKEFTWDEQGRLRDLYLVEEGKTSGLEDVDYEITEGKVDIMTAALSIMQAVTRQGDCGVQTEVFDGKRNFLLRGIHKGQETLKSSFYNSYEGEAVKCEIQIIPKEGDWHEKLQGWMSIQEQSQQAGTRPIVWLAQLKEGELAVPVKMKADTSYGVFMMHLKEFQ